MQRNASGKARVGPAANAVRRFVTEHASAKFNPKTAEEETADER
jgi:hypothetical protein